MRTRPTRTSMLLATATVLFASMSSLAFADTAIWSAAPAAVQSSPNVVSVAVTYAGRNPATGAVTVQAVVDGVVITSYVPVSLLSGQTLMVPVAFAGAVQNVMSISAGGGSPVTVSVIGDEANPF